MFQEVKAPRFQYNRDIRKARLSAVRADRLYPAGNIPGTHFCQRLRRLQCNSAAGKIMSMKNFNDIIGNRTHDLPAYRAVLQPTALPQQFTLKQGKKYTAPSVSKTLVAFLNYSCETGYILCEIP